MFKLFGALYLGWALGANDASNVFGPAVASNAVRIRVAIIIAAICVFAGAVLAGGRPMALVAGIGPQTLHSAFLITASAATATTLLIITRLPSSSSQAVLGAIVGAGLSRGTAIDVEIVLRCVRGWVLTPLLAAIFGFLFYALFQRFMTRRYRVNVLLLDRWVYFGLLIAGAWGSFALGANNAANVTGVFVGVLSPHEATLLAGISISLGILTFGHRLMFIVGRRLVQLEPPAAMIAMLAQALCVQLFALRGIPVSTSQALVGSVLGIGLYKGVQTINKRILLHLGLGWIATPLAGLGFSLVVFKIFGPS